MPAKPPPGPVFPGTVIKRNSAHTDAVIAVQQRLNALGMAQLPVNGLFDGATEAAVKRFQGLFNDLKGNPLSADGEVGELSWGALFGAASLPPIAPGGKLAEAALDVARGQLGVSEKPPGSNKGPEVERYLASVGLGGGFAWCAAFVYFCAAEGAKKIGAANTLPRTGGVLEMWRRAKQVGLPCITAEAARAQPAMVTAGMIFIMRFSETTGHTGFVEARDGGRLVTIEGNSNDGGSREGTGVFRLERRTLGMPQLLGFIGLP
ncbi:peptidoglycan-binding protein [Falsiroseomonas oryzae]|uniref:peptidoglycan-binding protein n=1 Tax=Falsiroseomonas oryzae TaxID=2766473 RepID=UPI0022EA80FF|nr:peptidoglycan-binding protein [Roseomonas sp. MO-31]